MENEPYKVEECVDGRRWIVNYRATRYAAPAFIAQYRNTVEGALAAREVAALLNKHRRVEY